MEHTAKRNPWWVVLGALLGLIVGNGPVMQFTFGIFIKPITEEFASDRGTVSMALLIGLGLTGIMTPVLGRLIDRFGIRTVTLPAIVLFAAGTALVGFLATSPTIFIVLFGILGVIAAGQTPLPYAKAVAGAFDHKRGLALGVSMAGVGLGTALLPQLAQVLVTKFGWREAYMGLGLLVFVLAFTAVLLCISEPDAEAESRRRRELPGLTAMEAFKTRTFWLLAVTFYFVALAASGVIAHVVPLLTDRGVAPQTAASAISAAGLALIAGRVIAGYLLDRIFAPHVAFVFFVAPLIGIVMLLTATSAPLAMVAAVLVGMGLGAEVDLIAFLLSRYLGMRSFGEIYGYLFAIFMLGSGSGPFLMGTVFQKAGSYSPGLITLGVGLAIASVLVTRLGPYTYPEGKAA